MATWIQFLLTGFLFALIAKSKGQSILPEEAQTAKLPESKDQVINHCEFSGCICMNDELTCSNANLRLIEQLMLPEEINKVVLNFVTTYLLS